MYFRVASTIPSQRRRQTTLEFLLVLLLLLLACVSPLSDAEPAPPVLGPNHTLNMSLLIVPEGVTVASLQAVNAVAGKMFFKFTGASGYYASLYRNDMNRSFYFHLIDNVPFCIAVSGTTPIAAQGTFDARFIRQTPFNGRLVNMYRAIINSYIATVFAEIDTGYLAGTVNTMPMASVQTVTAYVNTTSDDDIIFEVPKVCENAPLFTDLSAPPPCLMMSRPRPLFPRRDAMLRALLELAEAEPASVYRPKSTAGPLPKEIDHKLYATPVRDQSQCGACWAFSTAALVEIVRNKARGWVTNYSVFEWLSPQSLIDCVHTRGPGDIAMSFGCQGGSPYAALRHVVGRGIPSEVDYPFTAVDGSSCLITEKMPVEHPIQSALFMSINIVRNYSKMETAIMNAVATNGAAIAIINEIVGARGDVFYAGGIYDDPLCTPGLSHAVVIVGYGAMPETGRQYWVVKNSFGAAWGESGYFRLAKGINMCGVEDFMYTATPTATGH